MFNKCEAARENNSGISNIAFQITSVNISGKGIQTENNLQALLNATNHPVVQIPDLYQHKTPQTCRKNEGHGSSVTTALAFANRFPDFYPRQFSYFLLDKTRL
jgi:CRISPR/Cas system CSM-associated protein Csm2 small subunit